MVIGLGGLGCAAAQYLAAAGLGEMLLIDDDQVENSNLQRQVLHTEKSIGCTKVQSAATGLRKLNSELYITCLDQRQSEAQLQALAHQYDLILDCSDNLETRQQLNRVAHKAGKPLVSGAAIRMEGQVFCVLPAVRSACYQCISAELKAAPLSCAEAGVMSPIVGVIGSMQALEAIKILTNYATPLVNRLLHFDARFSEWTHFDVSPREHCNVCAAN